MLSMVGRISKVRDTVRIWLRLRLGLGLGLE